MAKITVNLGGGNTATYRLLVIHSNIKKKNTDGTNLTLINITEENLINRHGETEGKLIFDEYCKKQVTNGKTQEWFIEKHGEIKGNQIYKLMSINKAKGTSSPGCVSKVSQEFFDRLDHHFNNLFNTKYSKKNKESI